MEGAGEHKEVIARKFIHARMEFAVVDQAAGFADNEEREYNPIIGKIEKSKDYS
jgi:hypothetical protein